MIRDRRHARIQRIADKIVLAELLAPVEGALSRVHQCLSVGRVPDMADVIALGVLRHLSGMQVLRDQVRALLHLDPSESIYAPLGRPT